MKKVVIAGSAKLQDRIAYWIDYFEKNDYIVLDWPKAIDEKQFKELYPDIHKQFFENILKTDILFIMNEDKDDIYGYIGAESYAELAFGVAQNLIYNKNIELILNKMPSKKVQCYNEIKLWLSLGWIKIGCETKK